VSASPIRDVLLPSSDRVAVLQVAIVIALGVVAAYVSRRERALVLLSVGAGMTVVGLMALRTLH